MTEKRTARSGRYDKNIRKIKKSETGRKHQQSFGSKETADRRKPVGQNKNSHKGHLSDKNQKKFIPWVIAEKTLTIAGHTIRTMWFIISALILIAVILAAIAGFTFSNMYDASRAAEYKALSGITTSTFKMAGETVIYDKNGNVITSLHNTGYKYTPISGISDEIQKTYISSEDKDFLSHNGFSVKGIGRATVSLLKTGRITQGGSTITQQLVKNTLLSNERTFFRKLTEIFLATDLEKKYTKADIMEYYLNSCFYGNNCKGIYAASEYYFGKKPSDIDYSEAALLAAISKSPSTYNPEADMDKAAAQRNIVLKSLYDDDLITRKEYLSYCKKEIKIREHETKQEKKSYTASFSIYCAAIKLMRENGFRFQYRFSDKNSYDAYKTRYSKAYLKYSNALRNGGYKIYTSINPSIQDSLQQTVDKDMLKVSTEKADDGRYVTQSSATVIDNSTGYVTAIVGGRGTGDEYNRAFLSDRQPGSSIKPVVDYGPAFDTGAFFPGRIVSDVKQMNGPKNSEGTYKGQTTIREAIVNSRNTVAYDTLQTIGLDTGLSYLDKMRFSSLSYLDEDNMSASIGGFSLGVKNYELAGAYTAIENSGIWRDPTCVTGIDDTMSGRKYKDRREKTSVYKDSSAYMLTSTMEDVIKSGTGKGLGIKDMHSAGKTGTTNSLKDGWFAGYTPYYTCTVWVGNDDGTAIYKNYGARYAGNIWHDFMTKLHKELPDKAFDMPDSVVKSNGDYVATDDKETSVSINRQTEIEAENDAAEKALKKYEAFFITSENDVFEKDKYYDAASRAIADCSDEETRNAFLDRLIKKDNELNEEADAFGNLSKTKEAYEAEKSAKAEAKRQKELAEKQEETRLSNALSRFNDAIGIVNDADKKTQNVADALAEAEDNLEILEDTDQYQELKDQYDQAEEYYDSLPEESEEEGDE